MERARMASSVEKVDSVAGASQHREAARPRQLRASLPVLVVAVFAAARLAAQQEPQRVVRGLSFEGNHAIDDYSLSTAIATTNSSAFATKWYLRWIPWLGEKRYFNELEFRRDVVRLLLLYRQSGYMNAVVDTVVGRAARDVYVTFRIYEGDPVRLTTLDVLAADSILDVRALKRALPLQVGDPFNRALFQASADTLLGRLKTRGYPSADVLRSYDVDAAALKAVATLEGVPGPRMRVGDVTIAGAGHVDTASVRRMLSVRPGDWFRQDQLYVTQRDLYGLGMFRSVNVVLADTVPRPGGDSPLRQPAFLSPRHTASFARFTERRSEFKAYTRQAVGANLAVTFNARRSIPITLGYSFSVGRTTAAPAVYCQLFRLCDASEQAFLANRRRFGAVTMSGVRNQTNSVLDPTTGGVVTASLTHSSRLVGSDTLYEFNRGQLEVSRYYPIGRRGAFAWRLLGGTILPARRVSFAGQSVRFAPPDPRFYGGGPNSVRGYARNELGPRVYFRSISVDSVKGDTTFGNLQASATGGNAIFVANAELRIPTPLFPDRMRVAVFADVGQVWELEDPSVRGVRFTPGVGVRFVTPLGPVRLDAAYNGYPAEPGSLYLLNTTNKSLTAVTDSTGSPVPFHPGLPHGFWRRVVVQFAVGQAF